MGRVDFDDVEPGGKCPACRSGEGFRDSDDARGVEFVRLGVMIVEGDGAGSRDVGPAIFAGGEQAVTLPGALHAGLATGVRELNRRVCALPMQEVHDAGERGDVVVLPDAEVVRGDAPFGKDGGGFREDKSCTSDGAAAQMDQMPVVGEAVAAGVLAHRRDSDAVRQSEIAKSYRREEIGHND
jgi:hypothetical protein